MTPQITEATIRQMAMAESFERGYSYYHRGAVLQVTRRGNQFQAEVEGSHYEPYRVRITLSDAGIASADCTCPYDWGGICEHIVAVLLTYVHDPHQVEERPSLETMLAELDREQLQSLVLALARQNPTVADLVDYQILILQQVPLHSTDEAPVPPANGGTAVRQRRTPLNPEMFRRQVQAALHSLDRMRASEAYWHVSGVVDEIRNLAEQARPFIEAGDGRNALVILEAVTEAYVAEWFNLDDSDGEVSGLFWDLGPLWAEALLSADLSPAERQAWGERLSDWQDTLSDYGLDDVFDMAQTAALHGWDYPPLARVLHGEIGDTGAWEDAAPDCADELAEIRLAILERQGRQQEYLYLAEAEGQTGRYVTMLARMGHIQKALDYAMAHLAVADDALALAETLSGLGYPEEALRVATQGLTFQHGNRTALAHWVRDQARAVGHADQALDAALVALRSSPSLADYLSVRDLAGARWPALRDKVLADVCRTTNTYYAQAQVDILLHEGLVEEAIAIADAHPYSYTLVEQVVDAAIPGHPDWVIATCRRQAEPIISQGQSRYYHHAARWLQKARDAFQAAGRTAEWHIYLEHLIDQHRRKYSLVPLLEALRVSATSA